MAKPGKPLFVSFESGITNSTCNQLLNSIEGSLPPSREKEVHLLIGSSGGLVAPTLRAFHKLRSLPIKLSTYAMGTTDSSAITLLLAGAHRYSYPSSCLFFHEITQTYGQGSPPLRAEDLRMVAMRLDGSTRNYVDILTDRTKLTEEEANQLMRSPGVTMPPETAQKHGIIHGIKGLVIPVGSKPIAIRG